MDEGEVLNSRNRPFEPTKKKKEDKLTPLKTTFSCNQLAAKAGKQTVDNRSMVYNVINETFSLSIHSLVK